MSIFCPNKVKLLTRDLKDRVLVIDDELPVVGVIKQFLNKIGIDNVDLCTTVNCFEDYFVPHKYSMIVVDLNLTDDIAMVGFDIVSQIRKEDKDVIVMVITGYPESLISKKLIDSGIDDFLFKPLTLEVFSYRVLLNLARFKRAKRFDLEIHNRYDERIKNLQEQATEISRRMSMLFLGEADGRAAIPAGRQGTG